jgi:hypothetical protein
MLADLVDLHDIRVLQSSERRGLGLKSGRVPGIRVAAVEDNFERDGPGKPRVLCLKDNSHTSAPQHSLNAVGTELTQVAWLSRGIEEIESLPINLGRSLRPRGCRIGLLVFTRPAW